MNIVLALCVCIVAWYADEKSIQHHAKRRQESVARDHPQTEQAKDCVCGAPIANLDYRSDASYITLPDGHITRIGITSVETDCAVNDLARFTVSGYLLDDKGFAHVP